MAKRGRPKKTQPETPTDGETPPANTAAMTEDQRKALHFQHVKKLKRLKEQKDQAVAAIRNARKTAKADLGDEGLKEIDAAIRLATPEGEAEARATVDRMIRVAQWHGANIGAQLELLATIPLRDWYEEGKRLGLEGAALKFPDGISQADEQKYADGYHAGQAVLGQGFGRQDVAEDETDLRPNSLKQAELERKTDQPAIGSEPATTRVT